MVTSDCLLKMDQAWGYKGFGFEIWIIMLWNDIDNEKCFKVLG